MTEKRENSGLNMLRAFACLWVVAVHLEQNIAIPGFLQNFCRAGSTGVSFFFILSGYLVYQSLDRVQNSNWKQAVAGWWKKRAVRILPLYYVMILFYALYYSIMEQVPADETGLGWLRYLFLLNQWVPSEENFWMNLGAVWTISVFAFFYLAVPFYHRFVKSYRVSLASIALLYVLARLTDRYTGGLRPLQFLYLFAIGITVYLAVKEKKEWNFTALACPVLLLIAVIRPDSGWIPVLLAAIFIAASSKVCMEWPFVTKAANVVSRYSYSIYLIHVGVIVVMGKYRPVSDAAYLFVFAVALVVFSWLAYQLVEKRLGNLLLRVGKKRDKTE